MSETQPDLREGLARFIMEHSTYVVKEQAEWRADALIRGPLAPILAQVSALQAEVERLQKEKDEAHRQAGLDWTAADVDAWGRAAEEKGLPHLHDRLNRIFRRAISAEERERELLEIDRGERPDNDTLLAAARHELEEALERLQKVEGEREKAQAEAYALKLAAAGGEDAPGSASMVTPEDIMRWRQEGERREQAALRAAAILLPFVDMAAGEGLEWSEQEDGSPRMDAADLCVQAAEALGFELGDERYTALLKQGEDAIRIAAESSHAR